MSREGFQEQKLTTQSQIDNLLLITCTVCTCNYSECAICNYSECVICNYSECVSVHESWSDKMNHSCPSEWGTISYNYTYLDTQMATLNRETHKFKVSIIKYEVSIIKYY